MNCSAESARLVAALLAACCVIVSVGHSPGASAAPKKETSTAASGGDSLQLRQQELSRLKSELDDNRRKIEALSKEEKSLAQRSKRLQDDVSLTKRYLAELSSQDEALRDDLAHRQAAFLDMRLRSDEMTERMKARGRRYHRIRRVSTAELLLSARSFDALFARSLRMARLIQSDRLELLALGQERTRVSEEREAIESRRRGVEALEQEKRREEDRLHQQGLATRAKIEDVQEAQRRHQQRVKELERAESSIREMLARLERERAARAQKKGKLPPAGPGVVKGKLQWPVRGEIRAEFGFEVHPKYGTKTPMNGIVIAAEAGTPIQAAQKGTVDFASWLPGYGNTVILNHGAGFYTLYAHAASLLVGVGEVVEAGAAIARVGDTDSSRGACLLFEVRKGVNALDPRDWLP